MILLDTSLLVGGLTGAKGSAPLLLKTLERGEPILLPCLVLYEWLRGPRTTAELAVQEDLFPTSSALPYEVADAKISAEIYRSVRRARSREIDIAIAACAIRHEAALWTLNTADFADIPGLRLYHAKSNFS